MFIDLSACIARNLSALYNNRCSVEDFVFARVRGNQWEFPQAGQYQSSVEGVVLAIHSTRVYWEGKPVQPRCFSSDSKVGMNKQNCLTCRNNQFGTRGAAKACSEYRMLFLLQEGHDSPTLLNIPPTSLNSIRPYLHMPFPLLASGLSTFRILPTDTRIGRVVGQLLRPLDTTERAIVQQWQEFLQPYLQQFTPIDPHKCPSQ